MISPCLKAETSAALVVDTDTMAKLMNRAQKLRHLVNNGWWPELQVVKVEFQQGSFFFVE